MNVYVVTSGCYSDYRICRIFSNKEKAEKYSKGVRGVNDIEEYELDDDKEIELYTSIYISYEIEKDSFDIISLETANSLDTSFEDANSLHYCDYGNHTRVTLQRSIPKTYLTKVEENEYIDKYKKVIYDLVAQIKYLKEHDGFNEKQVKEWLKNK